MDMILFIKEVLIMGKLEAVDLLKRVDIPSTLGSFSCIPIE